MRTTVTLDDEMVAKAQFYIDEVNEPSLGGGLQRKK